MGERAPRHERVHERPMVSAEEHEALRRDLDALREQFEAADEVLSAIGRSAADPETVLTTIVQSASRLCRSQATMDHQETVLLREAKRALEECPLPG